MLHFRRDFPEVMRGQGGLWNFEDRLKELSAQDSLQETEGQADANTARQGQRHEVESLRPRRACLCRGGV